MWIESLHIEAFGGLRGLELHFGPGLTIIYGGNESGKSTLMAFVRAMLYGLNGRGASLTLNDRKRCTPWDGAPMAGVLRLRDGKVSYEIARTFGQTKKGDTCRVTQVETGETLPLSAGEEPGEALLGIDEDVFVDTLFLSWQGSRLTGDGAALGEKIRNRLGTGREDVDLDKLLARLHTARSAIAPRTRGKGSLHQTREALDAARAELAQSAQQRKRIDALRSEIDRLERARAAQRLYDGKSREIQLDASIRAARAAQRSDRRLGTACLVSSAALALAGIATGMLVHPLWLVLLAGAAALAAAGIFLRRRSRRASDEGPLARLEAELCQAQAENRALQERVAQYGPTAQEQPPASEADENARLLAARVELEGLLRAQPNQDELKARIAALEAREDALTRTAAALDLAQEELLSAARERQSGFLPDVVRETEALLARATDGKYAHAALSRGLELSLQPEGGALQPWGYFSTGTVELMYLALRLSLAGLLRRRIGPLPVLMDDPFLCLDDARAARCLRAVRTFAQDGQQALLLTCREPSAQACAGARVLRL